MTQYTNVTDNKMDIVVRHRQLSVPCHQLATVAAGCIDNACIGTTRKSNRQANFLLQWLYSCLFIRLLITVVVAAAAVVVMFTDFYVYFIYFIFILLTTICTCCGLSTLNKEDDDGDGDDDDASVVVVVVTSSSLFSL